jgi:hypothetical protein
MEELEQVLKTIGVKVKRFGRYKAFNRVLKEISKRWNKLTKDQQDKISKVMTQEIFNIR